MSGEVRIEATLRVPGEVEWIHDKTAAVPESGVCIRGERPGELDLFFCGRKVGYLLEYPQFVGDRYDVLGHEDERVTLIDETRLVCMLDLARVAGADLFETFVAGFEASSEGRNGEYTQDPLNVNAWLRETFERATGIAVVPE